MNRNTRPPVNKFVALLTQAPEVALKEDISSGRLLQLAMYLIVGAALLGFTLYLLRANGDSADLISAPLVAAAGLVGGYFVYRLSGSR